MRILIVGCRLAAILSLLSTSLREVGAQGNQAAVQGAAARGPAARGAAARRGGGAQQPPRAGRAALGANPAAQERAIRQAVTRLVRNQLGLNSDQMVKVGEIDTRFATERLQIERDEAQIRANLRRAMQAPKPDTVLVARLLERMTVGIPQRLLTIQRNEQRELGSVLNAVQRAQYVGIREQVRSRIESQQAVPTAPPPQADTTRARRGGRG